MAYILLKRFRGDTYPIEATLSRDTDFTLTGSDIKMTFIFDDDVVVHTFTGTVTSEENKTVEFVPTPASIDTIRRGKFDIQVDDGVYIATHLKGIINVVEDVTP